VVVTGGKHIRYTSEPTPPDIAQQLFPPGREGPELELNSNYTLLNPHVNPYLLKTF